MTSTVAPSRKVHRKSLGRRMADNSTEMVEIPWQRVLNVFH